MDSYNFILQLAFLVSFAVIIFVVASAMPRIPEGEEKTGAQSWVGKLPLKKMDMFVAEVKSKTLRRAKIIILKIENFINKHLHKDKGGSGLGGPKV